MNGRFHFAAIGRVAAAARRIISAVNFDHVARASLITLVGGDEVGVAQANFFARRQAIVLGRRNFAEVVLLNVDLAREGNLTGAGGGVFGVVGDLDNSSLPSG